MHVCGVRYLADGVPRLFSTSMAGAGAKIILLYDSQKMFEDAGATGRV